MNYNLILLALEEIDNKVKVQRSKEKEKVIFLLFVFVLLYCR